MQNIQRIDHTQELPGAGDLDVLLRIIDLLPNPVYVKDRKHRWVEVNAAFCAFLGYPREALLGKSDYDFNPQEQARIFWEMDDIVFESKSENINLEQTTNSAGELLWVESKKSYYRSDAGDEYIIGVLTDLTEIKAREADLVQANKLALDGAKAKTMFLANMSHEIRTPMNGVLGMAQVLHTTDLTDNQIEMVDMLERSGQVLLRLIDDILDFSKLNAGQMSICVEPFILKDIVQDVSFLAGVTARNKGLDLIVNYHPDMPVGLLGDGGRINQIITNLLSNAIKFTAEGYVLLDVSGTISGQTLDLNIRVKDTGIGIASEKLDHIFEKFQQADGSTTRTYGGTGLGLAISRELANLMGGTLTVASRLGEGSIFDFSVSLPIIEISEKPRSAPIDNSALSKLKILAVDDIPLNLHILESQLSALSLSIDKVASAEEAVQRLSMAVNEGEPYNLLLTDYQMPKIDGFKLVSSLKGHPKFEDLQIIVLSSVNDSEVRQSFIEQDITSYLVKPAGQYDLHRAISGAALQI